VLLTLLGEEGLDRLLKELAEDEVLDNDDAEDGLEGDERLLGEDWLESDERLLDEKDELLDVLLTLDRELKEDRLLALDLDELLELELLDVLLGEDRLLIDDNEDLLLDEELLLDVLLKELWLDNDDLLLDDEELELLVLDIEDRLLRLDLEELEELLELLEGLLREDKLLTDDNEDLLLEELVLPTSASTANNGQLKLPYQRSKPLVPIVAASNIIGEAMLVVNQLSRVPKFIVQAVAMSSM
jgi:hypothetical protein